MRYAIIALIGAAIAVGAVALNDRLARDRAAETRAYEECMERWEWTDAPKSSRRICREEARSS